MVNIFPLGENSQEPCDFSRGRFSGVLEFDLKDIEKAGYGYLIEEYFAEEEE